VCWEALREKFAQDAVSLIKLAALRVQRRLSLNFSLRCCRVSKMGGGRREGIRAKIRPKKDLRLVAKIQGCGLYGV